MFHTIKNISHDEWLNQRALGIGSSEVGTILGVNPYETPYELWLRKTGRIPPKEVTMSMELGHVNEAYVAMKFAQCTGSVIKESTRGDWLAVDNEKSWLRVSPDRLYWPSGSKHCPKNWRIVECKTTTCDIDPLNPPKRWLYQLQYQMGVMEIKAGAVAWMGFTPKPHIGYLPVEFDADLYNNEIVPRLDFFWTENILKDIAPTPTREAELKLAFPVAAPESSVIADEAITATHGAYLKLVKQEKEIKEQLKLIEDQETILKDQMRAFLKDKETLLAPDGKKILATWKNTKDIETFDLIRFREEQADTYAAYLKQDFDLARFREENADDYLRYVTREKGSRSLRIKNS